ncbi:MAG: ATP-binding protein [Candidatus Cloacimonetes bacterium]|jgi:signal transduction histidine kinase|nr:ATP-binding protein [Candidatus Cloacimonadota bacterium]MDD4155840.1 ATP-binding protein [Candidatus Cloacimonadota bacterium]
MRFKHLFKKDKIAIRSFIKELINSYSLLVDSEKVLDTTTGKLKEIFPELKLYFFKKIDDDFVYNYQKESIHIKKNSKLLHWLSQNQVCLKLSGAITEYIKMDIQAIADLEPQIILPVMLHNRIILIAVISNCKNCEKYLDFFNTIFQLMALAWESTEKVNRQLKQLNNDYQQKKMAMVGRMSSSIAHEIRNPLTSIRSSIQFLSTLLEEKDVKNLVDNILTEVDRINDITKDLLNFSKPKQIVMGIVDLKKILDDIIKLYQQELNEHNIKIYIDLPKDTTQLIKGDQDNLKQVLINFMQNSIDAMEFSNERKISIEVTKRSDSTGIFKWIDTGCGMSNDIIEHIQEPFYTTKKHGTGLGLSIVKQILEQHSYILEIKSKINKGTIFSFNLDFIDSKKKW